MAGEPSESVDGYRMMTFTLSTTILTILFIIVKRKYENNHYFPQLSLQFTHAPITSLRGAFKYSKATKQSSI